MGKDKDGKEVHVPQAEPATNGHAAKLKLPLFRILRRKKKTALDASGWELLTITRAEDEADALAIGRQMWEAEHGVPIKVEAVAQ